MPADLATSRLLREMGFAGKSPQMAWRRWVADAVLELPATEWELVHVPYEGYFQDSRGLLETLPAPELLSGDPEHPGALEFIESLGYPWCRDPGNKWWAFWPGSQRPYDGGTLQASSAEALIAAVHAHWRAQQPAKEEAVG